VINAYGVERWLGLGIVVDVTAASSSCLALNPIKVALRGLER
jgi:hypothetical protein